jgi:hypothetical protein
LFRAITTYDRFKYFFHKVLLQEIEDPDHQWVLETCYLAAKDPTPSNPADEQYYFRPDHLWVWRTPSPGVSYQWSVRADTTPDSPKGTRHCLEIRLSKTICFIYFAVRESAYWFSTQLGQHLDAEGGIEQFLLLDLTERWISPRRQGPVSDVQFALEGDRKLLATLYFDGNERNRGYKVYLALVEGTPSGKNNLSTGSDIRVLNAEL